MSWKETHFTMKQMVASWFGMVTDTQYRVIEASWCNLVEENMRLRMYLGKLMEETPHANIKDEIREVLDYCE